MNKFILIPTLIFCCFCSLVFSQDLGYDWSKPFDSSDGYVFVKSTKVDNSGNVYLIADFKGTVDVDPGPGVTNFTSDGQRDVFILKLNSSGYFIWAKQIHGIYNITGSSIDVSITGEVIVSGYFQGTAYFTTSFGSNYLTSGNSSNSFIMYLNSAGAFGWVKQIGDDNTVYIKSARIDGNLDIVAGGIFKGTVDFDPGPGDFTIVSNNAEVDCFILKVNIQGNFVWVKSFGNSEDIETVNSLTLDASDNIYSTGRFRGVVDFDPNIGVTTMDSDNSSSCQFIQKIDAAGNLIWVRQITPIPNLYSFSEGNSIAIDHMGNVICTGRFVGDADFSSGQGTGIVSQGLDHSVFVQKLDESGFFLWEKRFIGSSVIDGESVCIDNSNNIFISGYFADTVDFDPSINEYIKMS